MLSGSVCTYQCRKKASKSITANYCVAFPVCNLCVVSVIRHWSIWDLNDETISSSAVIRRKEAQAVCWFIPSMKTQVLCFKSAESQLMKCAVVFWNMEFGVHLLLPPLCDTVSGQDSQEQIACACILWKAWLKTFKSVMVFYRYACLPGWIKENLCISSWKSMKGSVCLLCASHAHSKQHIY